MRALERDQIEKSMANYGMAMGKDIAKVISAEPEVDQLHATAIQKAMRLAEKFHEAEMSADELKMRTKILLAHDRCEVEERGPEEMRRFMRRHAHVARAVFKAYMRAGGIDPQKKPTFDEVRRANLTVDINEWLQFATTLGVLPHVPRSKVTAVFHRAINHIRALGIVLEEQELTYRAFLVALRMLACLKESALMIRELAEAEQKRTCIEQLRSVLDLDGSALTLNLARLEEPDVRSMIQDLPESSLLHPLLQSEVVALLAHAKDRSQERQETEEGVEGGQCWGQWERGHAEGNR